MPGNGLDTLVADPQFQSLAPADQRRAMAGVSGDDTFSSLNDADTARFLKMYTVAPDQLTQQTNAAARAGGVSNPGVSVSPLTAPIQQAGAQRIADENRIRERAFRAQQDSITPFTNAASVMYPAAGAAGVAMDKGLPYLANAVGRGALKTVATTAAGSGIGAAAGAPFGQAGRGARDWRGGRTSRDSIRQPKYPSGRTRVWEDVVLGRGTRGHAGATGAYAAQREY